MNSVDFELAAGIVNAIRQGHWTHELPEWADATHSESDVAPYDRAVAVAEAFSLFFAGYPGFNLRSFLKACGLTQ